MRTTDSSAFLLRIHRTIFLGLLSLFVFCGSAVPSHGTYPDIFGISIARGDINNDGYEDLVVGALGRDDGGGAVEVYYGSSSGLSTTSQTWDQDSPSVPGVQEPGDRFGGSVILGDFNGDGYEDLAIGVAKEDIGSTIEAGAVNVLYGDSGGLTAQGSQVWHQNSSQIHGASEAGDRFGSALVSGDFNADGYMDLAIGVPGEDIGAIQDAGAINVIYGSVSGLTSVGNEIWYQSNMPGSFGLGSNLYDSQAGDNFGSALASGDFDANGYDDLAIGVPGESFPIPGGSRAGFVQAFFGTTSGLRGLDFIGYQASPLLLASVGSLSAELGKNVVAGDFNGDGYDDVAMGVPNLRDPSASFGIVMIGYHRQFSSFDRIQDSFDQFRLTGVSAPQSYEGFGFSLATGDFNGDGADDLAIGVPGQTINGIVSCGQAHAIYGTVHDGWEFKRGLTETGAQEWHQDSVGIVDGCEISDQAGRTLGAGDFNGDGFAELVIGVPQENGLDGMINIIPGDSGGLTDLGNVLRP